VETIMYWPINHMVSPKEQTVGCAECHTRHNGRLESLAGFYLPGRDYNKTLDASGLFLVIACLGGVIVHALFRIVTSRKREKPENTGIK
jgi:hypothetical protein